MKEVHGRGETIQTSEEYTDRFDLTDSNDLGVWGDTFSSCLTASHHITSYLIISLKYHAWTICDSGFSFRFLSFPLGKCLTYLFFVPAPSSLGQARLAVGWRSADNVNALNGHHPPAPPPSPAVPFNDERTIINE